MVSPQLLHYSFYFLGPWLDPACPHPWLQIGYTHLCKLLQSEDTIKQIRAEAPSAKDKVGRDVVHKPALSLSVDGDDYVGILQDVLEDLEEVLRLQLHKSRARSFLFIISTGLMHSAIGCHSIVFICTPLLTRHTVHYQQSSINDI